MNPTIKLRNVAILVLATSLSIGSAAAKTKMPEISHDGLVLAKEKDSADYVYVLPDIDLSVYSKVLLTEPTISFRRNWKTDKNRSLNSERLSDKDVLKLLETGKKLAKEAFTEQLEKGPMQLVSQASSEVLEIRISITELDIHAPDPNRTAGAWSRIYSEAAGDATLIVELFDSVTGQILVRAVDKRSDIGDEFGWRERTHHSNVRDAKQALRSWAKSLAIGLNRAMAASPR